MKEIKSGSVFPIPTAYHNAGQEREPVSTSLSPLAISLPWGPPGSIIFGNLHVLLRSPARLTTAHHSCAHAKQLRPPPPREP